MWDIYFVDYGKVLLCHTFYFLWKPLFPMELCVKNYKDTLTYNKNTYTIALLILTQPTNQQPPPPHTNKQKNIYKGHMVLGCGWCFFGGVVCVVLYMLWFSYVFIVVLFGFLVWCCLGVVVC